MIFFLNNGFNRIKRRDWKIDTDFAVKMEETLKRVNFLTMLKKGIAKTAPTWMNMANSESSV